MCVLCLYFCILDILSEKIQAMGVSEEMRPTLWRLNSEVRRFDQSSMNLVGTVEKNTLPTQEGKCCACISARRLLNLK